MFLLGSPFPVPQIPHGALLRSWFRTQGDNNVSDRRAAHDLMQILRALNPRAARQAQNLSARLLYARVLRECARRFPIQEFVLYSDEEEWDDDEAMGLYDTLPVAPVGYGVEDAMPPALVVCGLLRNWYVFSNEYAAGADLLKKEKWLNEYAPRDEKKDDGWDNVHIKEPPRPPRGRAWRAPWGALHDTFHYAIMQTGNPFLDYDTSSLDDSGWDVYPRLTLDEIHASEAQWKRAKPMLGAIQQLIDYIGTRPERMRLLADVLMQRRDALYQVTAPKPTTAGTLAAVFLRADEGAKRP